MSTDQARLKILLITRNLPPLIGGMERLMQNMVGGAAEYAQITVIGPKGCSQHLPETTTVVETSAKLAPFLIFSAWHAFMANIKEPFDIIIGGSGLTAPILRALSWHCSGKTLLFLHGLDLVVDNTIYQNVFIPCIRTVDSAIVNSRSTRAIAIAKGVDSDRIQIVNPGTRLPAPITTAECIEFRRRHDIPFARYIVFVGRITRRKGLSGFLKNILPLILGNEPSVGLVVVGEDPTDSLNQLGEQVDVLAALAEHALQENVVFLGKLADRDLEISYAGAEVQIFPLVEVAGDIEGFGMVAIEAAACGTPTVAFDLGGVADAISDKNGHLVPPGRFDLFATYVLDVLQNREPNSGLCTEHSRQFTWPIYNDQVKSVIDGMLQQ